MVKRSFSIVLSLWLCGASNVMAADTCSAEGISQLKHEGWTIAEIKSLCVNGASNQKSTQQKEELGQRCATKLGVCNLFDIDPVPVGTPCYCNNPNSGRPDRGRIIH